MGELLYSLDFQFVGLWPTVSNTYIFTYLQLTLFLIRFQSCCLLSPSSSWIGIMCMMHIDITGHALPGDQPDTCYGVISLTHHTQAGILLISLFPFLYLRKVLSCISLLIGYHVLVCSCAIFKCCLHSCGLSPTLCLSMYFIHLSCYWALGPYALKVCYCL